MTPKKLFEISTKPDNLEKAEEYLKSRGLSYVDNVGYVDLFPLTDHQIIVKSVVIFGTNVLGEINIAETRSITHKNYNKIFQDNNSIPIWRLNELIKTSCPVIITESVFDAEAINQNVDSVIAISAYSSSVSVHAIGFLSVFLNNRNVYVAFDNDNPGYQGTEKLTNTFKNDFGIDVKIVEFPYNDLNRFLQKVGKTKFKKHISAQVN